MVFYASPRFAREATRRRRTQMTHIPMTGDLEMLKSMFGLPSMFDAEVYE